MKYLVKIRDLNNRFDDRVKVEKINFTATTNEKSESLVNNEKFFAIYFHRFLCVFAKCDEQVLIRPTVGGIILSSLQRGLSLNRINRVSDLHPLDCQSLTQSHF